MAQRTELTFVTPEMAKHFLEKNGVNRKLRWWYVDRLVSEIVSGRWHVTNQGIGIDLNGVLMDGQHRLHAIAKCGIGVWMNVTFDMLPDSYIAIDLNLHRTVADALRIHQSEAEIYTMMLDLYGVAIPDIRLVELLHKRFGTESAELLKNARRAVAVYSSASVKASAIIQMEFTNQHDYICQTYRDLITGNIVKLPKNAQAFVTWVGKTKRCTTDRELLFTRSLTVFDKADSDHQTVKVPLDKYVGIVNNAKQLISYTLSPAL